MAGDPITVQQLPHVPVPPTPHPPVPLHPAGGVSPGGPAHNTPPQPAAHEPKLLVPGQAQDAKAAEDQAKKASRGFDDASANIAKLLSKHANPKEISKAERALYIAQGKAEFAAWHNLNVQHELKAQRSVILDQAEDELARAEVDVRDNPSPSTHAKLDAAGDRLRQASDPYDESLASVDRAEKLQHWVTSVTAPFTPLHCRRGRKIPNSCGRQRCILPGA
jgi:hypothetical protein